jgi:Domain of unknown function (DUF4252)
MQTIFLGATRATQHSRRPAFVHAFFTVAFVFCCQFVQAQDYGLYWKYKDYDGAIAVSMPGWVAKLGSLFIDKEDGRELVQKIKKVRVLVFQDENPIKPRDFKKFNRKAKRRNLDELVTVRSGKTRVQIYGKMRRSTIRKVVVLFSTPDEGSGMVSLKGKFKLNELNKAIEKVEKESKNGKKPVVPPVVKIPVSKV